MAISVADATPARRVSIYETRDLAAA